MLCKSYKHIKNTFELARKYNINEKYITTNFLIKSVSQNYALINWLIENNMPMIENERLNSIFSYIPGKIKEKFGVDIKELQQKYKLEDLVKKEVKKKVKETIIENKGKLEENIEVENEFEKTIKRAEREETLEL